MAGVGKDGTYDGIPFAELPIHDLVCTAAVAQHLRTRSNRKAASGEVDIEPEWAIEAVFDPAALVDDGRSRNGLTIRVTGSSSSAGLRIAVTLYSEDHPPSGTWYIATAWAVETIGGAR